MGQNLGVYSSKNVNLNIQVRTIQGYAEGTFINPERTTPEEFLAVVGATGDYTFQENLDKSGLVIFTLQQAATDNVFLQSLKEGKAIFSLEMTVRHSHKEILRGTSCMIGRAPRLTMDAVPGPREWAIAVGELIETAKSL